MEWNFFNEKDIYELKEGNGYINTLEYEGEYLNRRKNRNIKEYHYNNKLKFKGEYLNRKKNGKGNEYDLNENLDYEGEYLNDEKMEKEKNIIKMVNYYSKENIYVIIEEEENNII